MQRRAEFRPFSWLNDLERRNQLDLSPPYQRRSVWPERFRIEFINTVLMNYPCPAIFLYEEIRPDGSFFYKVVDGKQRLTTLFDFVSDKIAIGEEYPSQAIRGLYFSQLSDEVKLGVWRYAFSVEFIEQENEAEINDIFNRINKNVAKLSQQELRHALFSGAFMNATEDLAEEMKELLPQRFPSLTPQSQRQMKDVENVAIMLLFIESGERSLSQSDLDKAFADRDEVWEERTETIGRFRAALTFIAQLVEDGDGVLIQTSRLKNQADFYSLFAATVELQRDHQCPPAKVAADRLSAWLPTLRAVERGELPTADHPAIVNYLDAARAASNDAGPRRVRIDVIKNVLQGG